MTELKDQLKKFNMDKDFKEIIFQMMEKIASQEEKIKQLEHLTQRHRKFV